MEPRRPDRPRARAGPPGSLLCAIAAAIVVYMARTRASSTSASTCSSRAPAGRRSTRRKTRRLPRPARRHADPDGHRHRRSPLPVGVGDRGLAHRVRPARRARAGGRVGRRDRRRHARASCSRSSACSLFQQQLFGFLSFTAEGGAVFGRSFLTAGAMMSLIALPLVVGATREALQAIPRHVREASYALGKDRAATIRRVLLPGARPRDRDRRRRSAWAGSPATPRSS